MGKGAIMRFAVSFSQWLWVQAKTVHSLSDPLTSGQLKEVSRVKDSYLDFWKNIKVPIKTNIVALSTWELDNF